MKKNRTASYLSTHINETNDVQVYEHMTIHKWHCNHVSLSYIRKTCQFCSERKNITLCNYSLYHNTTGLAVHVSTRTRTRYFYVNSLSLGFLFLYWFHAAAVFFHLSVDYFPQFFFCYDIKNNKIIMFVLLSFSPSLFSLFYLSFNVIILLESTDIWTYFFILRSRSHQTT